ncbi:MAG TPA: lipoprotein [Xanthomonadales bacterium]|nr:lipoprotein [Xanthomonadales bacterium]
MNTSGTHRQRAATGMIRLSLLTVCLGLLLGSCGQRGPLYLPKEDAADTNAATAGSQPVQAPEATEDGTREATGNEDADEETP